MKIILIIIPTIVIIFVSLFYSCNTIIFYENINNEDKWYIIYKIPENEKDIQFELEYPNQESLLPYSNFRTHMFFRTNGKEIRDNISVEEYSLNIYKLNGELIEPLEQNKYKDGSITNIYKYSILFPNKIILKANIKFYYNGKYHEYTKEAKIVKKRNRFYWMVAMGI
jgi:hypothetical protein